jgi:hypothetical protein
VLWGALTAAAIAAALGLGQSGPVHSAHGQAVQEVAVNRPLPPGGAGSSGVAPPTISKAPNGDEVITYTDANGNS